ncbi:peptidoglycan-binding protein [Sphingomonas sp. 2R-10]|uniref:peptidoglycan-binding protein n=1 Tax=Sphingomonas sp. 2R-10 TaxID=3045148 RepID=UPI000F77E337|nr:peptidoglycan-binding protein [Sphingomonas sp. 2R-10]MDJ0277533.1 peptidoglycan-binding protein [Sphingomonas sp. 2R-10]
MTAISASMGRQGINRSDDVRKVQLLLRQAGGAPGPIDGIAGPLTIRAIFGFQQRFLTRPDGRVDPGGRTLGRLNGPAARAAPAAPPAGARPAPRPVSPAPRRPVASPPPAQTVGGDWIGDSEQWSQEKKLTSLESGFRRKIVEVIRLLKAEGFRPRIVFGWRSVAKQQELFRRGVTKVRFSFHNAQTPQGVPNAWAVDLVDERWAWNEPDCHKFFKALGRIGKGQGLVWGGDWASFRDWAHLQGRQNSELAAVKRESGL